MSLYVIILVLFVTGGIAVSIWEWKSIARGRKKAQWPTVKGEIVRSDFAENSLDEFPIIVFSYVVDDEQFEKDLEFPSGNQPSPEYSKKWINKYPVGSSVTVYCEPGHPEAATIEPQQGSDWMVFIIGLLTTGFGMIFILSGL